MLCGDSRRAQNLLSWKPSVTLMYCCVWWKQIVIDCSRTEFIWLATTICIKLSYLGTDLSVDTCRIFYLESVNEYYSRHPPGSDLHSINWLQGDYCDPHLKIPDCDWIIIWPHHLIRLCSDSRHQPLKNIDWHLNGF